MPQEVTLSGELICADTTELAAVVAHLPLHVSLTRAEDGCLSFDVVQTGSPLIWQVDERFRDAKAFLAHQERVPRSEWGRATAGIERRYRIEGLG